MGIGLKVTCPCFGSFTLQVGARLSPPKYCLFPFVCTSCKSASCLDIHADLLTCDAHFQQLPGVIYFAKAPAKGKE